MKTTFTLKKTFDSTYFAIILTPLVAIAYDNDADELTLTIAWLCFSFEATCADHERIGFE